MAGTGRGDYRTVRIFGELRCVEWTCKKLDMTVRRFIKSDNADHTMFWFKKGNREWMITPDLKLRRQMTKQQIEDQYLKLFRNNLHSPKLTDLKDEDIVLTAYNDCLSRDQGGKERTGTIWY